MAKPIEDLGHAAQATKPLRLRRYDPVRGLPDAGQCVDCLIIINDMKDGIARGRLAISNGATWDHVAWLDEIGQPLAPVQSVDVSALAREAVNRAIAEAPQPAVKLIAPSGDGSGEANRVFAQGMLEMSDHLDRLARENADLMARIEYIERHALAAAKIESAA